MLKIFEVLRELRDGELCFIHNYISEADIADAGDGATIYDMATVYSDRHRHSVCDHV